MKMVRWVKLDGASRATEGKTVIAVKKKNRSLLKHRRNSTRLVLIVLGRILFLSVYLPHTWGGEANLEEYYKTFCEIDKNIQEIKRTFYISGVTIGMDAQTEVKPHKEPFADKNTRRSRRNGTKYWEFEGKFERYFMEWIAQHDVKLANTFCGRWEPTRGKSSRPDFWKMTDFKKVEDHRLCFARCLCSKVLPLFLTLVCRTLAVRIHDG